MSLLELVVGNLKSSQISFGAIGAAALAHHGVSRATHDVDLLSMDARTLDTSTWSSLKDVGVEVEIRRGDVDDPLAGVVRFRRVDERPVDLIVGKRDWILSMLDRTEPGEVGGVPLAVVRAADLILLKLYAGGPQDAWDIAELLSGGSTNELVAEVETSVGQLPVEARGLWKKILEASR